MKEIDIIDRAIEASKNKERSKNIGTKSIENASEQKPYMGYWHKD